MKICGIYKITSPSGRIYIGSSSNLGYRKYQYSKSNCKFQTKLINSILKYSWDAHTFEIVEECEFEKLYERERYWGDFYDVLNKHKGLNCVLPAIGDSKTCISEETRQKYSNAQKGKKMSEKTREALSACWWGKVVFSEETRNKISEKKKGHTVSEETRLKISNSLKGRKQTEEEKENHRLGASHKGRKIICTKTNKIYLSLKEAVIDSGYSYAHLGSMLRGNDKNTTTLKFYE